MSKSEWGQICILIGVATGYSLAIIQVIVSNALHRRRMRKEFKK